MRYGLTGVIGMMALASASAVQAQNPYLDGDLRCFALLSAAVAQAEPDNQGNLIAGVLYFMGRLDGKAPDMDFKKELRRVIGGLDSDIASSEGQRCATILSQKGQALQSIGSDLQSEK